MVGTSAAFGATQADAALKQLYKKENFQESTYKRRPMIGIFPKDEGFYGRNQPIVNNYGRPQGVSATFSNAQTLAEAAATGAAKLEDFLLTRVTEHSLMTIDGDTLESMSNDVGAFVDAMKVQADGALKSLSDRLESLAPGTSSGALGRVSTAEASLNDTTFTLNNINDVHRFEVGMSLVAAATETGALRDSGATEIISAIDRINGVLTCTSATWDAVITAIAAGDYLFALGDAQAGGTAKCTAGISAWLPDTVTSTAFFGVDRTSDTVRLGGARHGTAASPTGGLVKTAIIDGASITAALGGEPDVGLMHHVKFRQLCKEVDSQTNYTKVPSRGVGGEEFARVSYNGVFVLTDTGRVNCIAANKMNSGVIFLLEVMTWKWCTIKAMVRYSMYDGLRVMRQSANDGIEGRMLHRGNLGCKLPGHNCRITHS